LSREKESKEVDHRDKRGDDGCYAEAGWIAPNAPWPTRGPYEELTSSTGQINDLDRSP
jgi:hypothetical protein